VALVCARPVLADTTPVETTIKELLLPFKLLLHFNELALLCFHLLLELKFEFLFEGSFILGTLCLPFLFFFLKVVNLFLKHLNVKLELLFDLDMVSHFGLIVLELLLILLGRQIKRVECRSEFRCGPIVHIKASVVSISV